MATVKKSSMVAVNFACQRCSMPLKLDHSFAKLDKNNIAELSGPSMTNSDNDEAVSLVPERNVDGVTPTNSIPVYKRYDPVILADNANGFMLVGESLEPDMECLSHRFNVTSRLFDVISDQSDIDHPLCEECTDAILDQMDMQLRVTEDEYKDYTVFLETLLDSSEHANLAELEMELKKNEEEELKLRSELQSVEADKNRAVAELHRLKIEKERLDAEEEHYWREYCRCKRQDLLLKDEQLSVDCQLKYAEAQLRKLMNTNVFNATFHIWYNGHFGTINNFRLGRLPNVPVDWHEINAAWGQTCLLLHSLARKIDLTFQRYRLVPYGNHSYIECLGENRSKELPLYGSGGVRFFWDTKFDYAMVAFLDCLQQFKEVVEKENSEEFSLPYNMDKGKIEETGTKNSYSIRIQFNSEEQWTKALKFVLTNLKWGLAWVGTKFADKPSTMDKVF